MPIGFSNVGRNVYITFFTGTVMIRQGFILGDNFMIFFRRNAKYSQTQGVKSKLELKKIRVSARLAVKRPNKGLAYLTEIILITSHWKRTFFYLIQ